ncbi:MAG TPA: hypothetical protein VNF68_13910 [Candidatus Baltobacteraceae bacterium]|nr:hypothetical protein [Candidatus Baltobacteraceae bacterium]
MSSSDFEAQLRQSVADNVALIANAAKAAKARIGQSVASAQPHAQPASAPAAERPADASPYRPTVNFAAEEPVFADEPVPFPDGTFAGEATGADEPIFAGHAPLEDRFPQGALNVDEFAVEGVDDEGIPVWEDPP